MWGIISYALFYDLRAGGVAEEPDCMFFERTRLLRCLPWYQLTRRARWQEAKNPQYSWVSFPWWNISHSSGEDNEVSVHADEGFLVGFGWLSARFTQSSWWFSPAGLVYESTTACFFGRCRWELNDTGLWIARNRDYDFDICRVD